LAAKVPAILSIRAVGETLPISSGRRVGAFLRQFEHALDGTTRGFSADDLLLDENMQEGSCLSLTVTWSVRVTGWAIIWVDAAMRAWLDPIRGGMDRAILIADPIWPYLWRTGAALRDSFGTPRPRIKQVFIAH
jgi:hypothetical protein